VSATYRWEVTARIARERIVAIVRSASADEAEEVAGALLDAGITVLEISLTTPGALGVIERLAARRGDALLGAGTVLDAASARVALLAGARFVVAPTLSPDVIAMGHRYGAPVLPGVQTASEIEAALSAGADILKLFPASTFGPDYLRAIRAALPQAPIMPTGGVGPADAAAWIDAGAVALGVGGSLTASASSAGQAAAELLAAIGRSPS
jgi:2-dehydro-3-deoxyphosphogluconate aldolase / (4S)-4-hydroxy-2-oxoglutarate aldolase